MLLDQTYPNRELVIVTDAGGAYRLAIEDYIRQLNAPEIRLICLEGKFNLGTLRNKAIEAAAGELIMQWDDDDLYHPLRIQLQYECLIRENAPGLPAVGQSVFFAADKEMFWVDWTSHSRDAPTHEVFPGSILAVKDARFRYPESGGTPPREKIPFF